MGDGSTSFRYGDEDDWAVGGGATTTTTPTETERWGPYGNRPIKLLALVAFIDSVDRGILPGVLTKVQDDLGFSDTAAGLLGSVFVLTGFLVVLPAGYLADRYTRTRLIAAVMISWGMISALNAGVRNYGQFLAVRAALGIGETIDNPASSSLTADYYAPAVRGRAFALKSVAPIVGTAVGTAVGGLVGAVFGWRWAFLIVGVPGSLIAIAVWRLPEPARGASDAVAPAAPEAAGTADRRGVRAFLVDMRAAAQVRSLRSLMVGSAIASGATAGLAFWAPAFYERHTSLGSGGSAATTGALILVGALAGTWAGGIACDRLRPKYHGAPMLVAGVAQLGGGAALMSTFLPMPLWYRMPVQAVGVALIVAGGPALATMISEVVRPAIRGTAYSVTAFLGAIVGAVSPLLLGIIADQFPITVDGETKGHIANAFLIVTPLVLLGALVVLRGRRYVQNDIAAAQGS